jgi:hypothetical protein
MNAKLLLITLVINIADGSAEEVQSFSKFQIFHLLKDNRASFFGF